MENQWQSPERLRSRPHRESENGESTAEPGGRRTDPEESRSASWEEILEDPEYKSRYDAAVQSIVQHRLRNRMNAEETLQKMAPVLEALEERYGDGRGLTPRRWRRILRGSAATGRAGEIAGTWTPAGRGGGLRRACRTSICCGSWRTRPSCG